MKCNSSSPVAEMGDRLTTMDMGRKVGAAVPLSVGSWVPIKHNVAWAEAYLVLNGILIHPTVWPQYTNVTDRQDNAPVAYGEQLLVTVAQKRYIKHFLQIR